MRTTIVYRQSEYDSTYHQNHKVLTDAYHSLLEIRQLQQNKLSQATLVKLDNIIVQVKNALSIDSIESIDSV